MRTIGSTVPALLTLSLAAHAQSLTDTSIIGLDDMFRPVEGPVLLVDASGVQVVGRAANGQAEFVPLAPWTTAIVALGESSTPRGTALGMAHAVSIPGIYVGGVDAARHLETCHQPIALPREVSPNPWEDRQITASPYHTRWQLVVPHDAQYAFDTEIAVLHTNREVTGFVAYNSVAYDPSLDELGVVLRNDAVDLGERGLIVRIDCGGHGFADPPSLSLIHLAYDATAPVPMPPATARVTAWEGGQAYVFLNGHLGSGDNLILLRNPAQAEDPDGIAVLQSYDASPPTLLIPEGEDGAGQDCTPEANDPPEDMEDCVPDYPSCWFATLFEDCVWTLLGTICVTTTIETMDDPICRSPGATTGEQTTETKSGGVSIGGKIKGVEIEATGSYEVSETTTTGFAFTGGANGCGQCWQTFAHVRLCFSQWQYRDHRYELQWSFAEKCQVPRIVQRCAIPGELTETVCQGDVVHTDGVCSRTCN